MRKRPACIALLLALAAALPCLAQDAGKPIIRRGAEPATQQAVIPQSTFDMDSGRVALALIGVISLILLLRYWGKQLFPANVAGGRSQAVRVLARCPLAPRQQVLLIQVGRRIVVAADCGSQLSSLCQITDADEVAALLGEIQRNKAAPVTKAFTAWFGRATDAFSAGDKDLAHAPDGQASAMPPDEREDDYQDSVGLESSGDEGTEITTRREIRSLTDKVRNLARELGGPDPTA